MKVDECYRDSDETDLGKIHSGKKVEMYQFHKRNLLKAYSISVLRDLSLFDLFVMEQTLKCDYCNGLVYVKTDDFDKYGIKCGSILNRTEGVSIHHTGIDFVRLEEN